MRPYKTASRSNFGNASLAEQNFSSQGLPSQEAMAYKSATQHTMP